MPAYYISPNLGKKHGSAGIPPSFAVVSKTSQALIRYRKFMHKSFVKLYTVTASSSSEQDINNGDPVSITEILKCDFVLS